MLGLAALLLDPSASVWLGALVATILIGAVLPELRGRAEALLTDLETLEGIKRAASAERDRFRAEARELVEERARLELLVEERDRGGLGGRPGRVEGRGGVHEEDVAQHARRIIRIRDGRIAADEVNLHPRRPEPEAAAVEA